MSEERSDPRRDAAIATERDIRPVVAMPRGGLSNLALAGGAVVAGIALFAVLDSNRRSNAAPAIAAATSDSPFAAPPTLYVPPVAPTSAPLPLPLPRALSAPTSAQPAYVAPTSSRSFAGPPTSTSTSGLPAAPPPQTRSSGGAALIVDTSRVDQPDQRTGNAVDPRLAAPGSTERARAAMLANRSTTVPQGTLIPAVLETAFDSTRPGFARALVQRDIRGFDGAQVLIPRGSRLIGEYAADIQPGQNRAMVAWARLIRPDGVTIALGSPSADPVGRGGIKADVNSHFLQRFAGAILQSTFDLGIALASRRNNNSVVIAAPGSFQNATGIVRQTDIRPTLRVRQGTSISVFVARDLDFTDVDTAR